MTKRSLRHIVVLFSAFRLVESLVSTTTSKSCGRNRRCETRSFIRYPLHKQIPSFHRILFLASRNSDDKDDEKGEEIDLSGQDWRAFRAKLVMGSTSLNRNQSTHETSSDDLDGIGALFAEENDVPFQLSPLDPSQWAYDSGKVIEKGAVILGGVEQDYGFGLRQQYFHKAAILVLDHEESTFTKGIILNRPSDLTLEDSINPGVKWRVWFGGDVQGLTSDNPEIMCLHTLNNTAVTKISIPIINDIQWTTFDAAKKLVKAGIAKTTDFWVFCGYAGWGPKQLMGELERKSWYMVATDSQTLLKELARLATNADPRDAGLETWALLMSMVGRSETAKEHTGDFDDLMLKEWALRNLLSIEAGGGAEGNAYAADDLLAAQASQTSNPFDRLLQRVSATSLGETIAAGTILRASPTDRSPFLLEGQELHKSLVLILLDDENLTVGVILNRPGANSLDVRVQEKDTGQPKRQLKVPLRYGGQFAVKRSEVLLWLHCNPVLKTAKVGSPIGDTEGIWKCTSQDMISAVGKALATPEDFLIVAGVSVWEKSTKGMSRGIQGEIRSGKFEIVPETKVRLIWEELLKQEVLTKDNLNKNLIIANKAWSLGISTSNDKKKNGGNARIPIGGLGEGYDEDDDLLVFKTDVKVSKLSDDALRSWIATFLLGTPSLGE
jgi:putative AlgH/UPF0301 family transcriptional regulator